METYYTLESFSPNQVRMARQFLLNLFAPYEDGFAEFRYKHPVNDQNMAQRFVGLDELRKKTDSIVLSLLINADKADMYVGVLPRTERTGKAAGVNKAAWYWADVDFKAFEGTDQEKLDQAMRCAEGADMVVHSGNGLHCYWHTGKTLDLRDPKTFSVFRSRLEVWQSSHCSDPVADLPRILRVPGCWNYKTEPRKPVILKRCVEISK